MVGERIFSSEMCTCTEMKNVRPRKQTFQMKKEKENSSGGKGGGNYGNDGRGIVMCGRGREKSINIMYILDELNQHVFQRNKQRGHLNQPANIC